MTHNILCEFDYDFAGWCPLLNNEDFSFLERRKGVRV